MECQVIKLTQTFASLTIGAMYQFTGELSSMLELNLLADFGEAFFPIAFVRQRVGVRAPEFFHHLALRHERTFRLRISEAVLHLAQRELRAGHHGGFVELLVELVRGAVERAPAFLVGLAPQRRLRVQPRKVPKCDANLAHGFELIAHDVAENFFERGVDDGIQKLWRVKTMRAADFAEIVKANRERQLARLQLLAAQLADEPRGFAEREGDRGVVIRLVVRERGVAGNRGAVFDFEQQRLVPQSVREEPELGAPDAEFLPEQLRREFGDVAKGCRAQRGERTPTIFADRS